MAANEIIWDYAPSGINVIKQQPFDAQENVFVERGPERIGKEYKKAQYQEFTDDTFTVRTERQPEWEHLGLLGPVLRCVIGDDMEVVFFNNASRPYSLHPHGLQYNKSSEGAPYAADGIPESQEKDDSVPPGERFTYKFHCAERSGPGPADPSSIVWMYHSHVSEVKDTNTGLYGVIIVTSPDYVTGDGTDAVAKDIDRELIVLFTVMDENVNWYLRDNIDAFTNISTVATGEEPEGENGHGIEELIDDEDFQESNKMHSINGFVYGNLQGLNTVQGERVRWYVIGLGNEVDLHTPHWHGATLLETGRRVDVVELLPGTHVTADMRPDTPGIWLFHCHVNDHIEAGMQAVFSVAASANSTQ
jgi:FtsP/CotA-like multicopper oxidase with cupredoxin domain